MSGRQEGDRIEALQGDFLHLDPHTDANGKRGIGVKVRGTPFMRRVLRLSGVPHPDGTLDADAGFEDFAIGASMDAKRIATLAEEAGGEGTPEFHDAIVYEVLFSLLRRAMKAQDAN